MSNLFESLSDQVVAAVEKAAPSVVQVQGHRRPAAGVVFADHHILTPAATDDDRVAVHAGDGHALEGVVLGRIANMGLTVVRVEGLARPALAAAPEPKPGQLAIALGRTWSGNVMTALAPVSVVGGPLRTGRGSTLDRVIRIQQAPHGALTGGALVDGSGRALGIITAMAIRGTTVVVPASLAWPAGTRASSEGGTRQGFIGVSSITVAIPTGQRGGSAHTHGLLITQVVPASPADVAGVLVGDLMVAFDGQPVHEPEDLLMRLRGDRVGKAATVSVVRGQALHELRLTVGERPRG